MATNFRVTGADLDTLFELKGSTTKRADISLRNVTVDISNNYADITFGDVANPIVTNYRLSGTDLGNVFAATGSLKYSLLTWGYNTQGQIGTTANTEVFSWTAVSASLASHTAAIRSDYKLFTWGLGTLGRLGDETTVNKSSPVQIGTSSWTAVSAGGQHTAAIRSDYALFTWGGGQYGQLGDGTTVNKSLPVIIGRGIQYFSPVQVGSSSWTAVSAGTSHTAAIRSDYGLFTWGAGSDGRLGDGTTVDKSSPVQIGTSSWTAVSASIFHTAGLKKA